MNKMTTFRAMQGARGQQGFTIIELVVVILLLGILTATALPRFMDITDNAEAAVVSATAGGLRTGLALYRATAIAENTPSGTAPSGFGDGTTLIANGNGYPNIANGCANIYSFLLQQGATSAIGTPSGAICNYSFNDVSGALSLNTTNGTVN